MDQFLKRLQIEGKFNVILSIQVLFLLAIAAVSWLGLHRLGSDQTLIADRLAKVTATTNVISYTNRLRIVHASLFGAARYEAYVSKRLGRLKELDDILKRNLDVLESLQWEGENKEKLTVALQIIRHYQTAFGPLFNDARTNPNADIPTLMEANYSDLNKARDALDSMLVSMQKEVDLWTAQDRNWIASSRVSTGFVVLAAMFLGIWLTKKVGKQVGQSSSAIENAMNALSRGNLSQTCVVDSQDELGRIADSLNQLIAQLREDIQAIMAFAERAASGSTKLAATSHELDAATQEISRGSDERRIAIEQSTTSIQEISASIGEVRNNTHIVEQLSKASLQTTQQGMKSVEEAVQAMSHIQESSEKVARITVVIAEIARQTNLLSLNAAIEAAKAGTQGKGFAVVAEEIRKLAERSAGAAKEINSLIEESGNRVQVGSIAVGTVDSALGSIQANVNSFAEQIQGITKAMAEQSRATEDVVNAMGTTMQLTERDASATTELASTITETSRTIEDLAQLAEQLRQLTNHFQLA